MSALLKLISLQSSDLPAEDLKLYRKVGEWLNTFKIAASKELVRLIIGIALENNPDSKEKRILRTLTIDTLTSDMSVTLVNQLTNPTGWFSTQFKWTQVKTIAQILQAGNYTEALSHYSSLDLPPSCPPPLGKPLAAPSHPSKKQKLVHKHQAPTTTPPPLPPPSPETTALLTKLAATFSPTPPWAYENYNHAHY